MGDSIITVVAILVAAILMFVFPLLSVAERSDDIAQLAVQTATIEFVDNIRSTGKIQESSYNSYIQTLAATGNSYDAEIEVKVLDENPGKKVTWASGDKIGENVYYSIYTSQILETFEKEREQAKKTNDSNSEVAYLLKEGDMVTVSVKNTNLTLSQILRNFFYSVTGSNNYQVAAKHSGIVTITGTNI